MDFYFLAQENEVHQQRGVNSPILYLSSTKNVKMGAHIFKKSRASSLCAKIKMLLASVGPCRDDSVVTEANGGAAPAAWMVNHNIDFQYSNSTRLNDLQRPENTRQARRGLAKRFN